MEYFVGVVLAFFVSLGATVVGLDRDRAFYPVVTMVVASYYALFAVIGGGQALQWELIPISLFHAGLIHNPGVPSWWPMFCMTYDLVAAAYLAWLLGSARIGAAPAAGQ
jgi:hypothetical protein